MYQAQDAQTVLSMIPILAQGVNSQPPPGKHYPGQQDEYELEIGSLPPYKKAK
jgi:hypothetical protein